MRIRFLASLAALALLSSPALPEATTMESGWRDRFDVNRSELATTGRNRYFVLEPGYRIVLASSGRRPTRVQMTVLDETEVVDGIVTRVLEEREWKNGRLVEVSRNFLAISTRTGDVYYFGEEVDIYRGGRVVAHEGAWRAGREEARFGMIMPGDARVGQKYYQEVAPGEAMDRAEHLSITETVETPAGRFRNCLRLRETTPLEEGDVSYKLYAPGIGLVGDGSLRLVSHGRVRN